MKACTLHLREEDFERADFGALEALDAHLVIAFFSRAALRHPHVMAALQRACAGSELVGCSTAGEIGRHGVTDHGLVVVGLRFARPQLRVVTTAIDGSADSAGAGARLAAQLATPQLRGVMVLAPGHDIDGSALTAALGEAIDPSVALFGGLAGDGSTLVDGPAAGLGARLALEGLSDTWTLHGSELSGRHAVAVGWYGEQAELAHGMCGGAQPFGPARRVTRAKGNVVLELDGEPALEIYRRYLGGYGDELPAAGLLFPFALLDAQLRDEGLIRTLVDIDEPRRALVLAGAVPTGVHLRLMHASTENLRRGAAGAAGAALLQGDSGGIALLVSCLDRKMVMGERIADEIEAVTATLPPGVPLVGFYANGEIGRPAPQARPCLNNQTMAITCLRQ